MRERDDHTTQLDRKDGLPSLSDSANLVCHSSTFEFSMDSLSSSSGRRGEERRGEKRRGEERRGEERRGEERRGERRREEERRGEERREEERRGGEEGEKRGPFLKTYVDDDRLILARHYDHKTLFSS